ncbi:MAG: protein-L-isoaspartate O-methyltransferase [Pseudomonadota bacterium]
MDFAEARTAMVDTQVRPNNVTKYSIIAALSKIERENFVPDQMRSVAYADTPIKIGDNRTLLDARVFSKLLDALNILPSEFVLDIGCGLGYSTAVIAELSEAVVGVETRADIVTQASENLSTAGIDNAIVVQSALQEGAAKHGPYDVIAIEGSIEMLPKALVKQLKDGGRIGAVQYKHGMGVARIGVKAGETISWREVFHADAALLEGFETKQSFTFG